MFFSQDKLLIVLHWDKFISSYQIADQAIEPIITEMRNGVILTKDDIISSSSNLYISRHSYDGHGSLTVEQTKMTSEAAIIGPISDGKETFWNCWYTEALIAAGFKDFVCYICDFSKLSHQKDELRLYLSNCGSHMQERLPVLRGFQLSVIPVVYEKLSHAIPEFMDSRVFINFDILEIRRLLKVCNIKKVENGLQVNIDISDIDNPKELIVQSNLEE